MLVMLYWEKNPIREQQHKGGKMESGMLGQFTITDMRGKIDYLASPSSETVKASPKQLNVMEWDTLIGAVQGQTLESCNHVPKRQMGSICRSFWSHTKSAKRCRDATRAFMWTNLGLNLPRWSCDTVQHPHQQDSTSCGVLDCKVAELLLEGSSVQFNVDEDNINSMRMEMARRLIDDSVNLTELCRICGETESGDRDTSDAPVDQWPVHLPPKFNLVVPVSPDIGTRPLPPHCPGQHQLNISSPHQNSTAEDVLAAAAEGVQAAKDNDSSLILPSSSPSSPPPSASGIWL
ncbi:uncharacterized protein LOC126383226 [Epinephelus moara]|uniref:uncharacterized protein LOC126383226 n=1 Tax=Epinephelus moara TaxID=300413 RepID=UPI00214F27B2|nr:uncharacterized protein LOC126383226 [Epinephelus moara]